jgi:hypothetical protein
LALNCVIEDGWIDPGDAPGNVTPEGPTFGLDLLRRARNRDRVDGHFAGLIAPGNRIELSDGLHTAQAIIDRIPRRFAGLVDLTVCNSVLLGELIKRQRPDCLIVMNRETTELRVRAVLYRHQLRYLATDPSRNYIDVLAELRVGLFLQGTQSHD